MNALERLESTLASLREDVPTVRVGGTVSEVAPTHYRVSGLSRMVRLGELIGLEVDNQMQIGEVVRIDGDGVTAKPFDSHVAAGLGLIAYRLPPKTLSPHASWKGRVINALGQPLDGAGALPAGERVMSTDADPPPAMSRARVRAPLQTGVRVIDLFTPICIGPAHRHLRRLRRRQVDPAVDAGAKRRLRHRRDGAGRRARPRGA